ncbi:alpha/beta fold hydrolase [Candidatus Woesebacteria bacterium]|nr:alpha/beta fold hydrolase [Candidatus Woesebacteria bacterium]
MQKQEPIIKNHLGEKLDTWVEYPDGVAKATVVMVHGFGTSKHETAGYFDDITASLVKDSFRVVRFDFSGYGKSEGKQEDSCYSKQIGDLQTIIQYVKSNYQERLYILAQSMGCFVTSMTTPSGIAKTIMTGLPNSNTEIIIDRVMQRFGSRPGARLNLDGISELPRSTGKIQKIGQRFWQDIKELDPSKEISNFSKKTDLIIVHWESDEIIGRDYLSAYDAIPTLKSLWLPGDHSVTKAEDRQNFIKVMLEFFNK